MCPCSDFRNVSAPYCVIIISTKVRGFVFQTKHKLSLSSVAASDGYIYKGGQCHPSLTYIFNI